MNSCAHLETFPGKLSGFQWKVHHLTPESTIWWFCPEVSQKVSLHSKSSLIQISKSWSLQQRGIKSILFFHCSTRYVWPDLAFTCLFHRGLSFQHRPTCFLHQTSSPQEWESPNHLLLPQFRPIVRPEFSCWILSLLAAVSWKLEKGKVVFAKPLQNRRPLQSPVCQSSPPPRGDGNCMLMMMVVIACYSIIIISANDDDKGGEIMTTVMLKMVMRVFDLFIARQGAWYDRGRGSSVRVFVYLFFININHQPFFPFYPKLKAWGILKLE